MNWVTSLKLKEVAQIVMGQSPDSRFYNAEGIGPPFLQGCAQFGRVFPDTSVYCTTPSKIAPKGSILFSVRAPVGEINIADRTYCIGRGLAAVIAQDVDASLLYYLLSFVKPRLSQIAQGSTFEAISSTDLKECLLPNLGDTQKQAKIADVLSTIDRAIEQTETLIAKYQRIKTGLMQDLLTRGIDENGNLRDPATHKLKPSPLGSIPEEWNVYRLADITVKIVDGVHHTPNYVEHGIPFITVKNLTASSCIDFTDVNYISEEDHQILLRRAAPRAGDVLVTKDGTLGVARVVPKDFQPFSIFVSVALLRPNPALCLPELIWLFFESGAFESQLGYLSAGTGLKHIHLEHFREFRLVTPPLEEQVRVFQVLNKYEEHLQVEHLQLHKLQRLKTGLMQDLLTGKVSVAPLLAADKEGKAA